MRFQFYRLKGVEEAINRLADAQMETNRLLGIYINACGIYTHPTPPMTKEEAKETRVEYNDPELAEILERAATDAGRDLTDEEVEELVKVLEEVK